jgi:hypothetical protein
MIRERRTHFCVWLHFIVAGRLLPGSREARKKKGDSMPQLDQDLLENAADLTADDHLAAETPKDAPDDTDTDLPAPDQDPNHVPSSTVDENGQQR